MQIVKTSKAPAAIGPYSQAVIANSLVFCSGQIALTPEGELVEGDVSSQAEQVMQNMAAVLEEAGTSFNSVVKTTIFLASMDDFAAVNEVYASYFPGDKNPARATVEVSCLPKNVLVEIDCIATLR